MSDPNQPSAQREPALCPTCGSPLPPGARYCPTCGTRVQPSGSYDPDAFRTAVDDVLDDQEATPGQPADDSVAASDLDTVPLSVTQPEPSLEHDRPSDATYEPVPAPPPQPTPPAWTASPGDWTIQTPASSGTPAPPRRRENRTLWIILAILGGIVFCCCALFFLLFLAASFDSSFQAEMSYVAVLM